MTDRSATFTKLEMYDNNRMAFSIQHKVYDYPRSKTIYGSPVETLSHILKIIRKANHHNLIMIKSSYFQLHLSSNSTY